MSYDLPQRLSQIANLDAVDAATNAFLASVTIADDARSRVQHEAHSTAVQICTLAEAMSDPEDADELYGALASLWLELRLQWQRHNDVANYDLMRNGEAKPIDLVRGSVSSYYFERIETLLQPDQIKALNSKALAIIDTLRQDVVSPAEVA